MLAVKGAAHIQLWPHGPCLRDLQVKVEYQLAVKEGIVDLGFQNPSNAAQLAAHHIDQVKVVHPVSEQGCVNLDMVCSRRGHVVSGEQVCQRVTP